MQLIHTLKFLAKETRLLEKQRRGHFLPEPLKLNVATGQSRVLLQFSNPILDSVSL